LTFLLTVDERVESNAGGSVSSTGELVPHALSFELADAYSNDATRKETLTLSMDIKNFSDKNSLALAKTTEKNGRLPDCRKSSDSRSDLRFANWLYDATLPAAIERGPLNSTVIHIAEPTEIGHEITFAVSYEGHFKAGWEFLNFSLGGQSANAQQINITLSPADASMSKASP